LTDKVDAKARQSSENESLTPDSDLKQRKKSRKRIVEFSSDESETESKTSENASKIHKVKRREDHGNSAKKTAVPNHSNSLQNITKGNASSSKSSKNREKETASKSSDHTSSHTLKQSMKADQGSGKPHKKDKIHKKSSLKVTDDKHDKPKDKQPFSKQQPTLGPTKCSSDLGEPTAKKMKVKSAKSSFSGDGRTEGPSKDDKGKQSLKDSQSSGKKKKKKSRRPDWTLNKGVLCKKSSCQNTAVFHSEWSGEFCSFQCAIKHANEVCKTWMRRRRETITS